jgi:electron transport complex protein RnfG
MRPVLVLTLVAFLATLLLATVSEATKEPIRLAKEAQKRRAIEALFDFEIAKILSMNDSKSHKVFGTNGEEARVLEISTREGYSGVITAVVGVQKGILVNYSILSHTETPGLGDKIAKEGPFKAQFSGKALIDFNWKVKKDGGDVDAITAATISSRAISHMLEQALKISEPLPHSMHEKEVAP